MGKRTQKGPKSHTLPSSPTHSFTSSSSSDFEFTISISPRKSTSNLYPADELFYKGQLLPLHLSPRISMVRTLLASSSSSSSDTTITTYRDSTGSTDSNSSFSSDLLLLGDCDSSRPSSVNEEDEFKRINNGFFQTDSHHKSFIKKSKYFSRLSRFSSVFRKETSTAKNNTINHPQPSSAAGVATSPSVKSMSTTAREVIRKYLKKVKPLYEKLSQKQQQQKMAAMKNRRMTSSTNDIATGSKKDRFFKDSDQQNYFPLLQGSGRGERESNNNGGFAHSFSGNLRCPRRSGRSYVTSCPSSMRSSPNHSGVLCTKKSGTITPPVKSSCGGLTSYGSGSYDTSSIEELQNAIQGAIAHCKNSMLQSNKALVSDEI